MIEWFGDLWLGLKRQVDAICVTTNGVRRANGSLVMGAGVALQVNNRFPGIDAVAGDLVRRNGSIVQVIWKYGPTSIVALPTKNHWRDASSLDLVQKSLEELVVLTDSQSWSRVLLTRPGCGNGGLPWPLVKRSAESFLDERFVVVSPAR